jgi:hypothetical protein
MSVIYVIGAPEISPGRVKIGVTGGDPYARMKDLQTGSPVRLELLHQEPGGREVERALHQVFTRYRLHREWFEFGELDPVAELRAAMGSSAVSDAQPAWTTDPDPERALRMEVWLSVMRLGPRLNVRTMANRLGIHEGKAHVLVQEARRDRERITRRLTSVRGGG